MRSRRPAPGNLQDGSRPKKKLDSILSVVVAIALMAIAAELGFIGYRLATGEQPADTLTAGSVVPKELVPSGTKVIAVILSTCPYCKDSVAAWNQISDSGVEIVAITRESREQAEGFRRETGAAFPILTVAGQAIAGLGIRSVPYTIVLGEGNTVKYVHRGLVRDPALLLANLDPN